MNHNGDKNLVEFNPPKSPLNLILFLHIQLQVMRRSPAGDDVEFAVAGEVGTDQVFGGHPAVVDRVLGPLGRARVVGFVDEDARTFDRPRSGIAEAEHDFVTAISVDVAGPEGVTTIERCVDDVTWPQAVGGLLANFWFDVNDAGLAVHRFDGDDESRAILQLADFDLTSSLRFRLVAGRSVAELGRQPIRHAVADRSGRDEMHALLARRDRVGNAVSVPIEMPVIVHAVQRGIQHLIRPRIRFGIGRDRKRQQPDAVSLSLVERRDHQLWSSPARDVRKPHAVRPRFLTDQMHVPFLIERRTARQPMNAADVFIEPAGSESEVDLAVAVDVLRRDANVISLGLVFDDDSPLPIGSLIPQHAILGDGDDVLLAVTIDIGQRHGVTDFADLGIERLGLERWELRRAGGEAQEQWRGERQQDRRRPIHIRDSPSQMRV